MIHLINLFNTKFVSCKNHKRAVLQKNIYLKKYIYLKTCSTTSSPEKSQAFYTVIYTGVKPDKRRYFLYAALCGESFKKFFILPSIYALLRFVEKNPKSFHQCMPAALCGEYFKKFSISRWIHALLCCVGKISKKRRRRRKKKKKKKKKEKKKNRMRMWRWRKRRRFSISP